MTRYEPDKAATALHEARQRRAQIAPLQIGRAHV